MNKFCIGEYVFFVHDYEPEQILGEIEKIRKYGGTMQYQIRQRDKVYKVLEDAIISRDNSLTTEDIQAMVDL